MCIMSNLWGGGGWGWVTNYVLTPAVNPLDGLGGMNTCDHHRAREHVRKPHNVYVCMAQQSHDTDMFN